MQRPTPSPRPGAASRRCSAGSKGPTQEGMTHAELEDQVEQRAARGCSS